MIGSRSARLAFALVWLGAPAQALSPIYPRAVAPPASAPGPLGLAGALDPAARGGLGLPPSLVSGPLQARAPGLERPATLPLLRRLGGLLETGRAAAQTLASFWTGAAVSRPAVGTADVPAAALAAARKSDREFLALAVEAARASPTASDILDRAEALARRRGRPIAVRVRDLGNNFGEYDYMEDRLDIHARFRDDPALAAPTLAHELLHVLQHEEGVPAEALELELEAHILTLRVMEELGLESDGGTFSAEAARRLALGPAAYIAWMQEQLPGRPLLIGSDLKTVRAGLEEEVADLEASERVGKRARARLDWALHDLRLVASASGRRRYRAFADRVERLIADEHRRRR
ncbi:MAG: hypothetical protein HY553_19335 [Elusimicrobia bacterium]|nr:hypothetical protein [Elusimicrobiota bacterium]